MSEEEKQAIEILKQEPDYSLDYYKREKAIDIVLNLIKKQEKIIDKLIEDEAIEVMCYDTKDERKEYEKKLKEKLFKEIESE